MRKTPSVYEIRHEERLEAILSSTKKLVIKKGFVGVTMSEVARLSHVSRQRLYLYFPNLDSLFYRTHIKDMKAFLSYIQKLLPSLNSLSGRTSLLALTESLFAYRKEHPEDFLFAMEFALYFRQRPVDPSLQREYEQAKQDLFFQEAILSYFQKGKEDGEFRHDLDPKEATFFWANTLQLIHEHLSLLEYRDEKKGRDEAALYEREALKALTAYLK
jgi:AcrR family transcriptional regulator